MSAASGATSAAAVSVSGPHLSELFVQLPTDAPRATGTRYVAASLRIDAPALLSGPFDGAARARVLGAFAAVLHRYAQQETVAFDLVQPGVTPEAPWRGAVIRCAVSGADPFLVAVAEVATQIAIADGGATWDAAGPPSLRAAVPNIAFTFLSGEGGSSVLDQAQAARPDRPAPYDLHVGLGRARAHAHAQAQADDGAGSVPSLFAVYNASLFEEASVDRMLNSFLALFAAAVADPTIPVNRLPVLSAADHHKLTVEWDSGHASAPAEPAHRAFEAWARARPGEVAVEFQGASLTYRELDERSNRLAHFLVAAGVARNTPVAVCVLPSFDVLVALLAIFKAGGIYLPLDPTHPETLLAGILEEAQPRLVLTQSKLRELTNPGRFTQFHFDSDGASLADLSPGAPSVVVSLDDPGTLLYTSGTTGKPKGVAATHRNLAHYLHVARQKYGFRPDDVFCSLARYTFSISMFELLSPLCCGAKVRLLQRDDVLAPDRLALTLQEMTVVHAGPSLMGNLFRHLRTNPSAPRTFPGMRHASSGGDLVPPHLLEEMKLVFENAEIFTIYGSTEISCMGTTYPVPRDQKVTRSLVGKPFADVAVRLIDPHLNLVPFGVVGEICFSGAGVVPGYFKRPELTAEKFIELEGRRFYRMGDMGRLHADGNLEILGRRDFQVQLRGIRIELSGIENAVRELGLAWQCAVVVKKLDEYDARLVAFVVKPRDDSADVASFRRALAAHLPDYMLPQSLVVLDGLPVTPNGKLDRRRLQELPWQSSAPLPSPEARVAPRNTIEHKIAAAFRNALGIAEVGIDDDFFDLGGHSLLAFTLLEQLENTLGVTYSPEVLFQHTTVRALAAYSQGSFTSDQRPIPLNGNRGGPALFVLVGVHLYRPLARRLEADYSVRAVYAGRELTMFDAPEQAPSVDDLARAYVDIIRRDQPQGPYRLVGMSFGGIVAYEVARQLRAAKQEVSFLGLLDAVLPESGVRRRLDQAKRLAAMPRTQMLSLVSRRVRRMMKDTLSGRSAPSGMAEFQRAGGDVRLQPFEDQRQEAYRIATEAYVRRMTRFEGNAVLVVAGQRMRRVLLQSPCLGWSDVITDLRIRAIDSNHLELLEEPHVSAVAEIFLAHLQQTENRKS